jgi:hypothetical protein
MKYEPMEENERKIIKESYKRMKIKTVKGFERETEKDGVREGEGESVMLRVCSPI